MWPTFSQRSRSGSYLQSELTYTYFSRIQLYEPVGVSPFHGVVVSVPALLSTHDEDLAALKDGDPWTVSEQDINDAGCFVLILTVQRLTAFRA